MSSYHIVPFIVAMISAAAAVIVFTPIDGLQCMRPEFVKTRADVSLTDCVILCHERPNCQAFSMAEGPCQLFVFHRCSKYVRHCNCSRRARVFVKQQPGLPPGAMCPEGFKDDLCGTKYQIYNGLKNWTLANATIAALPGLTIFADVTDATESSHLISTLMPKYNHDFLLVGGFQTQGSWEPKGGWHWVGCGISISGSSSLWFLGQPDNASGDESIVIVQIANFSSGLIDNKISNGPSALAECVSPFD